MLFAVKCTKSVHIYHCVRFLDIFDNSLMIEQTACTNVIPDSNGRNDCRIRDCRTDDRLHHAHEHARPLERADPPLHGLVAGDRALVPVGLHERLRARRQVGHAERAA